MVRISFLRFNLHDIDIESKLNSQYGKTAFYKAWVSKGILRIKDILNAHDNFLSFQELKDTFHIRGTFLDYGGLLAAIPKDWKNATLHGNQEHTNEPTVTQLIVGKVSAKYARLMFAEKSFCPSLINESYLREKKSLIEPYMSFYSKSLLPSKFFGKKS